MTNATNQPCNVGPERQRHAMRPDEEGVYPSARRLAAERRGRHMKQWQVRRWLARGGGRQSE